MYFVLLLGPSPLFGHRRRRHRCCSHFTEQMSFEILKDFMHTYLYVDEYLFCWLMELRKWERDEGKCPCELCHLNFNFNEGRKQTY